MRWCWEAAGSSTHRRGLHPPHPGNTAWAFVPCQPRTQEPFQTKLYELQGTTSSLCGYFQHGNTYGNTLCNTQAAFKSRIQILGSYQFSLSRQMKQVVQSSVQKLMSGALREDLQINLLFVGIKKTVVLILDAIFLSFKCHRLHYLVSWLLETGKLHFNCFLIQLNLVQKLVCTL